MMAPSIDNNNISKSIYCFKKANYDAIREHLTKLDLCNLLSSQSEDVNKLISKLYDIIYETFDNFVPSTSIRASNKPIWYSKQLASMKNKRNKIYGKLRSHRVKYVDTFTPLEEEFLKARAEYESCRKQLFSNYLISQSSNLKNDPKSFWRHINSKRVPNTIPSTVTYKGVSVSSDDEKASLFDKFFQSVYTDHDNDCHDILDLISERSDVNCYNLNISTESVYLAQ